MMSEGKSEKRLRQCVICDDYLKTSESFYCTKCRRGPLCKRHMTSGRNECISCTIDVNISQVRALKRQERSIQSFLRLIHFVFLVSAIFFISLRTSIAEEIPLLENNLLAENVIYIGAGSVLIGLLSYAALFAQRQKITTIESDLKRIGYKN